MPDDEVISDLWEDALDRYEKMAPERSRRDKNLLVTIKNPQDLEAHLDKHEKSFKLFRSKHGKLRDRLQSCLQPFMALSDIISAAVSASPFAPASTVLGAVCFVLKAAEGVSEVYDWIEELFDKLRDFTVRLDMYVQRGLPNGFRDKIVEILGCLLEILACAEVAVQSGRWKKFAAVLFLGGDERVQAAFDKLAELFQSEQSLVLAITYATNQKMNKRIEEIGAMSEALLKVATSAEAGRLRLDCLEWISPTDFSAQQSDNLGRRQGNTGEWFLENAFFKNWRDKGSDESWGLFCPGAPGAGKTTMAATVIHHLSSTGISDKIGLAYLYCNYRSRSEQTLYNQLTALLRRLVQIRSAVPTFISDVYNKLKHERKLTIPECIDLITSVCKEFERVYVVVDAVDECQEDVAREVFKTIGVVREQSDIRLMMTARFISSIQDMIREELGTIPQLEVRASDEDIRQYFRSRLPGCRTFLKNNDDLSALACEKVVEAAGGMFLLARLHIDWLTAMVVPAQVKSALSRTFKISYSDSYSMKVYSEQYDLAMERILDQPFYHAEIARATLSWMTFARRPLSPIELCSAVAMCLSDDKNNLDDDYIPEIGLLISSCAGLVAFDEEANVIRHVHYTTQEYFEQTHQKWLPDAEKRLALTCIAYLSLEEFRKGGLQHQLWRDDKSDWEKRLDQFPLFDYAARFWGQHARLVEGDIIQEIQMLLGSRSILGSISSITTSHMETTDYNLSLSWLEWDELTPMIVCVQEKLTVTLHKYLFMDSVVSKREDHVHDHSMHDTPLAEAASHGYLDIVELLLNQTTNISLWDGDGTALWRAAEKGFVDIVQALLNFWNITEHDLSGSIDKMEIGDANTLHTAPDSHSMQSDRLVHPHGTIQESLNCAVACALRAGHEQVARLLVRYGGHTEIYAVIKDSLWLTETFMEEIIERFIKIGCSVDSLDSPGNGSSGLHFAAVNGYEKVVRLLLKHGADAFRESDNLGTVLEVAAKNSWFGIVQLLLEHGVNIDTQNRHGSTALIEMAVQEYGFGSNAVRFLIDHGAQVDKYFGCEKGTALMAAASRGHEEVCKVLLSYGADVNLHSGIPAQSVLETACWQGNFSVVVTVLEHRAEVPLNGLSFSRDFMNIWSYRQSYAVDILEHFRKHGVRLDLEGDELHEPAIYQAVRYGSPSILKELLKSGADINSQFGKHGNILHQALVGKAGSDLETVFSVGEYAECVEVLLDYGFDINASGKFHNSTLAATLVGSKGGYDIATPLLSRGVRIESDGPELLEQCVLEGITHVAQYLIDGGVQVKEANSQLGN